MDRIIIKPNILRRLVDSVETAIKLGEGFIIIDIGGSEDILFSEKFACPDCGISIEELAPRMFSFNNPFGKCPRCDGLGTLMEMDPDLIIPDRDKSINEGAIEVWKTFHEDTWTYNIVESLGKHYNFSLDTKVKDLRPEIVDMILYGTKGEKVKVAYNRDYGHGEVMYPFEGVVNNLKRRYRETSSEYIRSEVESFMSINVCPECSGQRLKKESRAVTVGGVSISQLVELSVKDEIEFIKNLKLSEKDTIISKQILKEITARLKFLSDVGLNYLSLSRAASSLSGGESQRIRLATQIGSGLVGVLYILDEPSIGLHQKDNEKLLKSLRHLTDIGNTLIVVEHDEDTMYHADYIVDIGPGAGAHGGEVVAAGTLDVIKNCSESITGQYLSGKKKIDIPEVRRKPNGKWVEVINANENNLKNIDVSFPLGVFTCVTGVSGSGKSTLVNEILFKVLSHELNKSKAKPGSHGDIKGVNYLDKVIDIDQSPIGRTPRSNPATYTGVFDLIRAIFTETTEAKMRGYKAGRFSFNVKGGRCEACSGDGIIKIEMQFLPDVYVPCEICKGKRYNRETLEVKYKGKNISEVLDMTVEEAHQFFENIPKIKNKLATLNDVGLSYVKLGQPSTQLSGGEAQRVKLATELSKRSTGKTMYILDEPTTGLHVDDVKRLIFILQKLTDAGNSVVVIEHNLDVIKSCDYIIDLGPDGGDRGGTVLALGTPEEVAINPASYTGEFLEKMLLKQYK